MPDQIVTRIVPLLAKTLSSPRQLLLRADLDLWVLDKHGRDLWVNFRVDPGSEVSMMPLGFAKELGIDCSAEMVDIQINGITCDVVLGAIDAKVSLSNRSLRVPILFKKEEGPTPGATQLTGGVNLLGLAGVVDKLRLTFDGQRTTPLAPFGVLIVEEIAYQPS